MTDPEVEKVKEALRAGREAKEQIDRDIKKAREEALNQVIDTANKAYNSNG